MDLYLHYKTKRYRLYPDGVLLSLDEQKRQYLSLSNMLWKEHNKSGIDNAAEIDIYWGERYIGACDDFNQPDDLTGLVTQINESIGLISTTDDLGDEFDKMKKEEQINLILLFIKRLKP